MEPALPLSIHTQGVALEMTAWCHSVVWVGREFPAYFGSCPGGQQAYGVVVPEEGAAGNDCMASSVWIPLSRIEAALGVGETSWLVHWEVRPLYSFTRDDLREEKSIVGLRNKAGNEHQRVESQETGLGGTLIFPFTSAHPREEPVPPCSSQQGLLLSVVLLTPLLVAVPPQQSAAALYHPPSLEASLEIRSCPTPQVNHRKEQGRPDSDFSKKPWFQGIVLNCNLRFYIRGNFCHGSSPTGYGRLLFLPPPPPVK